MVSTPLSSLSTQVSHSLPETTSLAVVDARGERDEMRRHGCFKDEKRERM